MNISPEMFRLYAVTDRTWAADEEDFFRQIEAAVRGGAAIVQLREKRLGDADFLAEAKRFVSLCRRLGAVSIINDRADIALTSGADGVHVGQSDLEAERARALLGPDKIVGVSAHSPEEARQARKAGANYLGCGAAFATGTKSDAKPLSKETIRTVTAAAGVPVVAIGGVNRENILELRGLGLAGVAVVSGIFAQGDVEAAARELRELSKQL
ncbi:MAG: thiamine phosphate synthase [Oscillibacter sp.]|jgi:thiamine-phosphate pyrophosphorylase|nr:thiamine phosphate synthase [Oscillibacter sp.]